MGVELHALGAVLKLNVAILAQGTAPNGVENFTLWAPGAFV